MTTRSLPPGWPRSVPPPIGDAWVRDGLAWLLDQCPAEYRGIPVLRHHPRVLLVVAQAQVQAQREGTDRCLSTLRTELRGEDPRVVAHALAALESEQVRLELVARAMAAIAVAVDHLASQAAG